MRTNTNDVLCASVSVEAIVRDFQFVRRDEVRALDVYRRAGWIYGFHAQDTDSARRTLAFMNCETESDEEEEEEEE
jgi:hypothetical protein